jgi:hypothetical protein
VTPLEKQQQQAKSVVQHSKSAIRKAKGNTAGTCNRVLRKLKIRNTEIQLCNQNARNIPKCMLLGLKSLLAKQDAMRYLQGQSSYSEFRRPYHNKLWAFGGLNLAALMRREFSKH